MYFSTPRCRRASRINFVHGSRLLTTTHAATCKFTEIPASALGSLIKLYDRRRPGKGRIDIGLLALSLVSWHRHVPLVWRTRGFLFGTGVDHMNQEFCPLLYMI